MSRLFSLFAVVLVVASTLGAAPAKDANVLKLQGGEVVAPDGFVWKKVHQEKVAGKIVVMYAANSKDSTASLFVALLPEKPETDEGRIGAVKGFYESMM